LQKHVNLSGYENKNIEGNLDSFWLNGKLRISPKQQIDFLIKLYSNSLPFSNRNISIVKNIFVIERSENYVLRAKTGWAHNLDKHIGWYIGYLEQNENVYFFAVNIDIENRNDAKKREIVARNSLKSLELL
jgi:beta-lactamase class D